MQAAKRMLREREREMNPDSLLGDDFLYPFFSGEIPAPFGFNGLGEVVYRRTYARKCPGCDEYEEWWQTIKRVVDGTMKLLLKKPKVDAWLKQKVTNENAIEMRTGIHGWKIIAENMFEKMFNMKFLPGGRGLWAMGSPLTSDNVHCYESLFNCAFVSTKPLGDFPGSYIEPFLFAMNMLMLGVGVGFDTVLGQTQIGHKPILLTPLLNWSAPKRYHLVADTREGWVESVRLLLESFFFYPATIIFDYHNIRPKGKELKTLGGIASGPDPLIELHKDLTNICTQYALKAIPIDQTWVTNIMNMIGKCVVMGGIRRTAQLAAGTCSEEFLNLKNYEKNPSRKDFGWCSNNSVVVGKEGLTDLQTERIAERILDNGEPGILFIENARARGRSCDESDYRDALAEGTNPCGEQTLESYELCNLVEVFISRHDCYLDFQDTLFYALLYGKIVADLPLQQHRRTEAVTGKNKRIGIGLTGIADFLAVKSKRELIRWCNQGYASLLSEEKVIYKMFGIEKSIKLTTIKPSGTLSLMAGVCPGVHFPTSTYAKRRITIPDSSSLLEQLVGRGYEVYTDGETGIAYACFPIAYSEKIPTQEKVTIWEHLSLVNLLQTWWSDNQVSCTFHFDPDQVDKNEIARFIRETSLWLKSISMLPSPKKCLTPYKNMPFEAITKTEYEDMVARLVPTNTVLSLPNLNIENLMLYCESDKCQISGDNPGPYPL